MKLDFYLDKAEKLSNSGNNLDAQKIYYKLLKKFPSNIRILKKLERLNNNETGNCNKNLNYLSFDQLRILFEKRSFSKVIFEGKKTLSFLSKDFTIHNLIGAAYLSLNKSDEAIIFFENSIKLNKDFSNAYNNLGLAYKAKSDFSNAIKSFDKAIKLNPSYDNALSNLGLIYWEIGNLELAFSNLNFGVIFFLLKYNVVELKFQ